MMAHKMSQSVTIPATKAHRQFGDLIRRAYTGKEHFIVEKDDLPVVVILSVAEYEALMQEREGRDLDRQERLRRLREAARTIGEAAAQSGLTEEEVMQKTEEIRQQLYEQNYGRRSGR